MRLFVQKKREIKDKFIFALRMHNAAELSDNREIGNKILVCIQNETLFRLKQKL